MVSGRILSAPSKQTITVENTASSKGVSQPSAEIQYEVRHGDTYQLL